MLVDQHFPEGNSLRQILNRNTIKISYRCTPNLAQAISGHNSKILREGGPQVDDRKCNCPRVANCPLDGNCLQKNLVYQATVVQEGVPDETYIGLSAPPFKLRIGNHKKSFRNEKYEKETTLSKHVWKIKRQKKKYDIKWKLIQTAKSFNPVTGVCSLCTAEKFHLIFTPELGTLNKREEINNHCRHKVNSLLDNT